MALLQAGLADAFETAEFIDVIGDPTGYDGAKAKADVSAGIKSVRLSPGLYNRNIDVTLGSADVPLAIPAGALVQPQAGKVVTVLGEIIAGRYQIFDMSAGGTVVLKGVHGDIPAEWFGARAGDSSVDSAAAVQAAHDSISQGGSDAGSARVVLGGGRYYFKSNYQHKKSFCSFTGQGKSTIIEFMPTADDQRCITIDSAGSDLIVASVVGHFLIESTDVTYRKVGVEIRFASETLIENIEIGPIGDWTGGSGNVAGVGTSVGVGSIGFLWRGHDAMTANKISSFADRPHVLDIDPDFADYDLDHCSILDCYSVASGTNPNIEFVDGFTATNVTIGGYQAEVAGKYGIYGPNVSIFNLTINGLRHEQTTDPDAWAVRLGGNVKALAINNFRVGGTTNGLHLRNVQTGRLYSGIYDGTVVAIDIDNTCEDFAWDGCSLNANGGTITATNQQFLFSPNKPLSNDTAGLRTAFYQALGGVGSNSPAMYIMGTLMQCHKTRLVYGGVFNIPTEGTHKMGILHIAAGDDDGSTLEGGTFILTPNAVKKVAGTANTNDANAGVNLIVFNNSGQVSVVNAFDADAVDVVITITWIT